MPVAGPPQVTAVLPARPGVYRFRDARGHVLYVGRASDLRSRVRSYWGDLRGRRHLVRMVARIDRVEAVVCQSRREASWLERSVLEHRLARWNRTPGGQEVPVWLRVTDLGVRVEHEPIGPGAHFGPYLGGVQARNAAAGLDRIYPFRHALARSGAARDLARIRGVLPGDGALLRACVVAVLSGERSARDDARAELVGRRQAAADSMDFERAATIQCEVDGLDWITQPSRVLDDGPDADVHGWWDGVLVTFELRDGHIRDWRTARCSESDAEARLGATAERWRGFAAENAILAARLEGSPLSGAESRQAVGS